MTRRGQGGRVGEGVILVGSAEAVRAAMKILEPQGVRIKGAALLGEGDAPTTVIARADRMEDLSFAPAAPGTGGAVVLTETPDCVAAVRALLARAAQACLKVSVLDGGALRALTVNDLIGPRLGAVDWARIQSLIAGKRVLITGAGGSIGSELARRIASLAPARLTLLDISEFNLYAISQALPGAAPALADIRDAATVRRWFNRERPDIVFHAAALKQVPLVEAFPSEGVLTNVTGLRNVAEAARAVKADLIFVSTDKAVDPSGVMGASKRLGELYCQALDREGRERAMPVRLGNVLGSAGSVTPLFAAQLARGGPLTVTDAEVTRFFISIPQAADVLLQAAALGLGAKATRGAVLTIDMGEALPVVELARDMIRLEGLRPGIDVSIAFVGMRPGERLHEQLVASDEWREADPAPGVFAAMSPPRALDDLHLTMDRLTLLARQGADAPVVVALMSAVETGAEDKRAAG